MKPSGERGDTAVDEKIRWDADINKAAVAGLYDLYQKDGAGRYQKDRSGRDSRWRGCAASTVDERGRGSEALFIMTTLFLKISQVGFGEMVGVRPRQKRKKRGRGYT